MHTSVCHRQHRSHVVVLPSHTLMYTTGCPDFNPIDLLSGGSYQLEKKHIPKTKKIDAQRLLSGKTLLVCLTVFRCLMIDVFGISDLRLDRCCDVSYKKVASEFL
jgi:hypothetical protein